jgi:hypothetical protein
MGIFLRDPHFVFGNDVVDLFEERDRSAAFLDRYVRKICTDAEASFLRKEDDFEEALWKVWALKESAFKAVNRRDRSRSFRYRELEVQPGFHAVHDHGTGLALEASVFFERQSSFETKSRKETDCQCVVGIAWSAPAEEDALLVSWIDHVEEEADLSREVREQAASILRDLEIDASADIVQRRPAPDGELLPPVLDLPYGEAPVSLSHHGRLVMTTMHLDTSVERYLKHWQDRPTLRDGRRIFFLPAN